MVSTNLNEGETATLTAEVYGYFDVDHTFAEGNEDCEPGKVLSTFTQDVTGPGPVSYTHLRAHETVLDLVCRLLLEKKKQNP